MGRAVACDGGAGFRTRMVQKWTLRPLWIPDWYAICHPRNVCIKTIWQFP